MEIKIGDKIKLKRNIIDTYGISESMINRLSNRILTVSYVDFDFVRILEDDEAYLWSFEMFDKIDDKSYIKEIKTKNKIKTIKVIIKIY